MFGPGCAGNRFGSFEFEGENILLGYVVRVYKQNSLVELDSWEATCEGNRFGSFGRVGENILLAHIVLVYK